MAHGPLSTRTIAERVAAALSVEDDELMGEVRALERIALGRSLKVAANGKFPHWTLERWMAVIAFIGGIVMAISFWGGEWRYVKDSISAFNGRFDALTQDVGAVKSKIEQIEQQDARRRQLVIDEATTPPRRPGVPQFGR